MKFKNLLLLAVAASSLALSSVAGATDAKWLTSYDEAVKLSKKTGKPILADFTGSDWCSWCKKLKAEVFGTPTFQTWAAKNVILLELDFPRTKPIAASLKQQNQKLAQKYSVRGFPTILFLKADGSVLGQSGYMPGGATAWTKHASQQLKK
ncbi:MAG: thioredoxin family protein [Fimbriimonadaceae bacterium]|nr:thioredoxin family protein [Fimbriimonadaceae bacterium]